MSATSSSAIEVTCPECGTLATINVGGRASSDFCQTCDYPLFWAKGRAQQAVAEDTTDALFRAPGTSGAATPSAIGCPACGEQNPPVRETCLRCHAVLRPPPAAPTPPPAAPEPVIVINPAPVVECNHWPSWAVALVASATTAVLAVLVVVLIWP